VMHAHHIASLSGGRLAAPPSLKEDEHEAEQLPEEGGKVIQLRSREQSA
jgi:hypothetical protein